jgi:hypothetical protein
MMTYDSAWKRRYCDFRDLEHGIGAGIPHLKDLLYSSVSGLPYFERRLKEYRDVGRQDLSPDDLRKMEEFARARSSYNPVGNFVYEDAYHIAFHMLSRWRSPDQPPPSEHRGLLYRGQRDVRWSLEASIFRWLSGDDALKRRTELETRARNACAMAKAVGARLKMPFTDAMAVTQHYSPELALPTWLLDFSRDPWVGLFFATDRGEPGQCGVVWRMGQSEYVDLSAGGNNPIGELQLAVPKGVPRIDNQAGVFVAAAHPELLGQYVFPGRETQFHQRESLLFEDPYLGITRDRIYPTKDNVLTTLAGVKEKLVACGCGGDPLKCVVPTTLYSDPRDPGTYDAILRSWLQPYHGLVGTREEVERAFGALARFHALLQQRFAPGMRITVRSFNRLREALMYTCQSRSPDKPEYLRDIIRWAYNISPLGWNTPEETEQLRTALDEVVGSL